MMFTPKNLIALPLLHFPQNSIAILQYFNELESYWNIAIYCNNSINCNLLQYDAIKQRSDSDTVNLNIPLVPLDRSQVKSDELGTYSLKKNFFGKNLILWNT